ncbi:META domain-containing protein [Salana multivorans]
MAATATVVALAACGGAQPARQPASGGDPLETPLPSLAWRATSGNVGDVEVPVITGYDLTVVLDSDEPTQIGGRSACNSWGAPLTGWPSEVEVGEITSDAMLCENVSDSEERFREALGVVSAASWTADTLVLTGPGAELVLEPVPPVDLTGVTDVVWRLAEFANDAESPLAPPSFDSDLELHADGTYSMTVGCVVATGEWSEGATQVYVGSSTWKGHDCPTGDSWPLESEQALRLLEADARPVRDGDTLVVTAWGGVTGVFTQSDGSS